MLLPLTCLSNLFYEFFQAQYLTSTFEMLWKQAVPAKEQIQELWSGDLSRHKGRASDDNTNATAPLLSRGLQPFFAVRDSNKSRGLINSKVLFLAMVYKTILENVKDIIAASLTVVESAKNEIIWLLPPQMLVFAGQFGVTSKSKALIEKGGRVRGITQISETDLRVVRELLDIGEDVRHVDQYRGEFMVVVDKTECISSIPQQSVNIGDLSLDDRVVGFWTDEPAYAEYLITTFEAAWKEAVDAKKRIEELLQQDLPQS